MKNKKIRGNDRDGIFIELLREFISSILFAVAFNILMFIPKVTRQFSWRKKVSRERLVMNKMHLFNMISGLIVLLILGSAIATGSNLLPYFLITLFFIFYYLQVKNRLRTLSFIGNVSILIFSLATLLPFLFAP